jgi:hypothetical protein
MGDEGEGDEVKEAMVWECKYGADPGRRCVLYFFVTKWVYQFGLFVESVVHENHEKKGLEA